MVTFMPDTNYYSIQSDFYDQPSPAPCRFLRYILLEKVAFLYVVLPQADGAVFW